MKPEIKDSNLYFAGQSRACCHCTNPQEKIPYSHERGEAMSISVKMK